MQFTYRAKQDRCTEASGTIEALDLSYALTHLKGMGLYPVEVVPLEAPKTFSQDVLQPVSFSRTALALWARTVGQGLEAGLSLTQALHLLAEQEQGRPTGKVAQVIEGRVTAGMSLADAMEQMGSFFPPVAIHLVRAGEASGSLEQVLRALAAQVESESDLIAKVRGALVYPLFVLTVGVGTVAVLMWVVVPKLSLLFAETGQPIPWMTRLLIGSGQAMIWVLGVGLAGFLAAGIGMRRGWFKIPLARWGRAVLSRLPWFGRLTAQAEIARLASTLGLLLQQGLPLLESLRLTAGTVGGPELKAQIQRSQQHVMEGVSLSASLRKVGLKEPFLLTMVAMGEAQGDLARAFQETAVRYKEEVDRGIKTISSLIEPVMILVVGLIVGGIVFSMLLPIFQINFTVG